MEFLLQPLTLLTFFPLMGLLILLFIPSDRKDALRWTTLITTLITFAISIWVLTLFRASNPDLQLKAQYNWIQIAGWNIQYYLAVDGLSILLVLLTTLLTPISILSTWTAVEDRVKDFMIFFLLLEIGMNGVFLAQDLFLFYIFWEFTLVPMYFIIGIWGGPRRIYAAIKFFLYTMAGSILMLLAILFLGINGTTFSVPDLISKLPALYADGTITPSAQMLLFLAFTAAFAIKVPMWPLHSWLPDAHVEAPTAGSVILAGVLLKLGGYGFLRFSLPLLPNAAVEFAPIVIALAVIAILYGAMVSMVQPDLKKLIAYSSVSHMGFVMLGAFVFNVQGLQGAIFQMISHGITTGALFLLVGVIYERTHDRLIAHMGGLNSKLPRYAAIFGLFTFASIGLPGLSGFVGEFLVMLGAFQYNAWVAAAAMIVVILSAVYMLWMFQRVFFTIPSGWMRRWWPSLKDMNGLEWAAL